MRHRGAAVRGCAGTGLAVSVSCLLPCTPCCRGIGRRTEAWRTARLRQLLPRGAFYSLLPDTGRKVPPALLKKNLSIVMMVAMFAGLALWLRPTSLRAWGMLLYIMIAITTTIGIIGWLVFNRYFWCSVCPMGKIYKTIWPLKNGLRVADTCVKCGLCAKACPFGFFPPGDAKDDQFRNPDCMHCRRCVERCPRHALSLSSLK